MSDNELELLQMIKEHGQRLIRLERQYDAIDYRLDNAKKEASVRGARTGGGLAAVLLLVSEIFRMLGK